MIRTFLTVLALAGAAACTNVSLVKIGTLGDEIGLAGEFCTSPPQALPATTRFLFMIDNSNSMRSSDPDGYRFDAVQAVVDEYTDAPNVLFAIGRWGDEARLETLAFTRDPSALARAIDACRSEDAYLGNTNYLDAIDAARDLIEQDARVAGGGEHTDYIVEFVTDGMPTVDTLEPHGVVAQILDTVGDLVVAAGAGNTARLDTLLFGSAIIVAPDFVDLLPAMAQRGNGRYVQVFDPLDVVAELPRLSEVDTWIREFGLRTFFAISSSAMVARVEEVSEDVAVYVDSDGDGLPDEQEDVLGTSAFDRDTDADGVSDLVERRAEDRDPLSQESMDAVPWDLLDEDQDGLNGLEERVLGLDGARADSDDDGIPDGLEVRFGTDPHLPDARGDYDDDGYANIDEIRQHTSPRLAESEELRREVAYRYGPSTATEDWQGRTCYAFAVENVSLVETAPEDPTVRLGGLNQIQLLVLDAPANLPQESYAVCEAAASVEFRDGMRDPNRLRMHLRRGDFCP